jgi:hypothetical protein
MTKHIAQTNKKIEEKTARNALIYVLHQQGLTYNQIRNHPKVLELDGGIQIANNGRISQIIKKLKEKGGESKRRNLR